MGACISYAMAANSMAIYWYWLIITLWVTYLVLKQNDSTPNPYWPLLLMPDMERQKQKTLQLRIFIVNYGCSYSDPWFTTIMDIRNCIMDIRVVAIHV